MKKQVCFIFAMATGLLITAFIAKPVSAQFDFDAYLGTTINDTNIDGAVGTEWDDAGHYFNVSITPGGVAEIWTKHDGSYLYIAIRFAADSSDPWLALQLDTTGCMDSTADVAIFGHNDLVSDGYSDAYFQGMAVDADTGAGGTQDGVGAMDVNGTNFVTIELKKPLSSGDTNGNDIAWSVGNTYSLVIAWDSDGGGSSGGSTNHRDGTLYPRTIYIDPEAIPEFSGLMLMAVLIAASVPLVFLFKKIVPKPRLTKRI